MPPPLLQPPKAKPEVWVGTAPGTYTTRFTGTATSHILNFTATGGATYASPILNHVLLKNLIPGTTYYYIIPDTTPSAGRRLQQDAERTRLLPMAGAARAAGPVPGANPFAESFTVPAATFPLTVGVWGDPGQVSDRGSRRWRMLH